MKEHAKVIDLRAVREEIEKLHKGHDALLKGQRGIREDQTKLSSSIHRLADSIDGFKTLFKATVPIKIVVFLLLIVLAQVGGIAVIQVALPQLLTFIK